MPPYAWGLAQEDDYSGDNGRRRKDSDKGNKRVSSHELEDERQEQKRRKREKRNQEREHLVKELKAVDRSLAEIAAQKARLRQELADMHAEEEDDHSNDGASGDDEKKRPACSEDDDEEEDQMAGTEAEGSGENSNNPTDSDQRTKCEQCKNSAANCIVEGNVMGKSRHGPATTACSRCKTKKIKCSLCAPSKRINQYQLAKAQKNSAAPRITRFAPRRIIRRVVRRIESPSPSQSFPNGPPDWLIKSNRNLEEDELSVDGEVEQGSDMETKAEEMDPK
ncbi:hypothetical protein B0H19DRAFT_1271887 [Mycena capillaripes]|nr:hypothetical protein B0H19DRAFT_1271887 [Mycena capillaripes]